MAEASLDPGLLDARKGKARIISRSKPKPTVRQKQRQHSDAAEAHVAEDEQRCGSDPGEGGAEAIRSPRHLCTDPGAGTSEFVALSSRLQAALAQLGDQLVG